MKKFFRKALKILTMACVMAMFGVFGAVNLASNPSTSSATVGKDYLLYVNTGTAAVPVWTLIGGQRGSSLGRTADSIDVSHKTSGGWKSTKAGMRGWSIDLDGLVLLTDAGLEALELAFSTGVEVQLKFEYPNKSYRTGWAAVTDLSIETPHDGEASLSGSLEGNGALSELTPAVTPLTVTVSKAAATDQTFTIAPSTTTIATVKNGAAELTVTTNYTYAAGALVIKGTYLGGLTVGTQTLTVTTGEGAILTLTVNLTA
jgi:TP901-1 family phage major tail protein